MEFDLISRSSLLDPTAIRDHSHHTHNKAVLMVVFDHMTPLIRSQSPQSDTAIFYFFDHILWVHQRPHLYDYSLYTVEWDPICTLILEQWSTLLVLWGPSRGGGYRNIPCDVSFEVMFQRRVGYKWIINFADGITVGSNDGVQYIVESYSIFKLTLSN